MRNVTGSNDLLKTSEVAELLRLNPQTVRKMLREGQMRGIRIGIKLWRVRRAEVGRLLGEELRQAVEPQVPNNFGLVSLTGEKPSEPDPNDQIKE